jgi:hypothetical protein
MIIIQVYCPYETLSYERRSKTITIPPARVALLDGTC